MRFLKKQPPYDLTYSDVFMVPRRSAIASRLDVDLRSTDGIGTTLPLVVANMTAISGRRMAETVARRGGIAIVPQDIPTDVVAEVIGKVKRSHPVYDSAISVAPHTTVGGRSPDPQAGAWSRGGCGRRSAAGHCERDRGCRRRSICPGAPGDVRRSVDDH